MQLLYLARGSAVVLIQKPILAEFITGLIPVKDIDEFLTEVVAIELREGEVLELHSQQYAIYALLIHWKR